jgi:hypothetical protein
MDHSGPSWICCFPVLDNGGIKRAMLTKFDIYVFIYDKIDTIKR